MDHAVKLAFSTNAYTRFGLIPALEGIRAAGFAGVEILADVPHAYPGSLSPAEVKATVDALNRLELTVSNVNANCSFGYWKDAPPEPYFEPSLISPNAQHRADRAELIFKALDFAKAVGAKNISITSGRCLGGMPPEKAALQFRESILPILDRADGLGIDVGVECEPGLFLESSDELANWILELNHPRFGANLDIGHSQVLGEDLSGAIQRLRGRIWNLHVEDIPGRKHYHLIPGEGTLPWETVIDGLREIEYERFLTVELYTQSAEPQLAAEKSFIFLSRLISGLE